MFLYLFLSISHVLGKKMLGNKRYKERKILSYFYIIRRKNIKILDHSSKNTGKSRRTS
jgi:hypothetical protein